MPLCTSVRGSKQAPVEAATCALYWPFETTYSLRKIDFARGFLPGLPTFTRYFACLHDRFPLVMLCHFFPQWLVERSTGTPGHPQEVMACSLPMPEPWDPPWELCVVLGTITGSSRAASLFCPQCTADSAIGGPQPGGVFPP